MNSIKNMKQKHSILATLRKIDNDKKYQKINELFIRKQDIYLLNLIEKRSLRKKTHYSKQKNRIFEHTRLNQKLPEINSSNILQKNKTNFQDLQKKISNSTSRSFIQNNFNFTTAKTSYNVNSIDNLYNNSSQNSNKMCRIQRIKVLNKINHDFNSEPKSDINNDLVIIPCNKRNNLNIFNGMHLSERKKNLEITKSGKSENKNKIRNVNMEELLNFLEDINTNRKLNKKKNYKDVCCGTDDDFNKINYTMNHSQLYIKKNQINKMLKGVPNIVKRYYGVTDEY